MTSSVLAMCFEVDSTPPIPAIAGAAVSHDDLVLRSGDGAEFAGFFAEPEGASGNGVVILPDVRGLYRFYEELALRFAERGIAALAIDYFGRSAGVGKRGDDFPFRDHVAQTEPDQIQEDVGAAVDHLRSSAGARAVFTIGFCFGGRHSWLAAAEDHGLAGAIGFYGRPGPGSDGAPGPTQRVDQLKAPILALMGGADPAIPAEDIGAFERALADAGIDHDVVIYDGAPHSFFDRRYDEFADASEDAWVRVLAFIECRGV